MMANPEMPGAQEEATAEAVPAAEAGVVAAPVEPTAPDAAAETAAAPPEATMPEVPRPRSESADDAPRRPAPSSYEPQPERMPLMARVLIADFAVAVIALIALFVIEVQRFGDATLHLRREAWAEDLAVLFGVSVLFGLVTFFLIRARHARVAIVQAVVTALVLAVAVTSAATGDPKPTPDEISSTNGTPGHPG